MFDWVLKTPLSFHPKLVEKDFECQILSEIFETSSLTARVALVMLMAPVKLSATNVQHSAVWQEDLKAYLTPEKRTSFLRQPASFY